MTTSIAADPLNLTTRLTAILRDTDVYVVLELEGIGNILHAGSGQLLLGVKAAVILLQKLQISPSAKRKD